MLVDLDRLIALISSSISVFDIGQNLNCFLVLGDKMAGFFQIKFCRGIASFLNLFGTLVRISQNSLDI